MDPVFTPLLLLLGFAGSAFTDGIKDFLKDAVKEQLNAITEPNKRASIERAYVKAMETALVRTLDAVLQNLRGLGYTDDELKALKGDIEAFARDPEVARLLLREITEPGSANGLTAGMLADRWDAVTGSPMPEEFSWTTVQASFRRQARKEQVLSDDLRALFTAQNVDAIRDLLARMAGPQVRIDREAYARSIRRRYAPVDLANLMPATEGDLERLEIRDVFVAPYARENPPPVEIPRDVLARLAQRSPHLRYGLDGDPDPRRLAQWQAHTEGPLRPVLDVLADPKVTRLVLTGDPGAGKSTLLRYLVTGLLAPPTDASGVPLPWTTAFTGTFPLLIELRDFHALREKRECNTFLDYMKAMGRSENWGLDDTEIDAILRDEPALVLFDGLDEVFDGAARTRYIREIAAFADRYPRARVVVTTRPLGYRHDHLRNAGFALYALQDLDDDQIRTFVSGWFRLTFAHRPDDARQRTERVLQSIERSRSIRLLAGNPMLLTLMALLARERDLPRERVRFYEQAVDVLCHHWDVNRHLRPDDDDALTADDKRALLRQVAHAMQEGDGGLQGNVIDDARLRDVLRETLLRKHFAPDEAAAQTRATAILRRLRERNHILCLRAPGLYGFVHRTFLEFLTADAIRLAFDRQPQTLDRDGLLRLYDDHAHDETWHEVLRLLCGSLQPEIAGAILDRLLDRIDGLPTWVERGPALLLALGCVADVHPKAPLSAQSGRLVDHVLSLFELSAPPGQPVEMGEDETLRFVIFALPHLRELGPAWLEATDRKDRAREIIVSPMDKFKIVWFFTSDLAVCLFHERSMIKQMAITNYISYRGSALSTLAARWTDDDSRTFLQQIVSDPTNDTFVRQSALSTLAYHWTDDDSRRRLIDFASDHTNSSLARGPALRTLAQHWRNDETRKMLTTFVSDGITQIEALPNALSTLAEYWPDVETRQILTTLGSDSTVDSAVRNVALSSLAYRWTDDETREIVTSLAHDVTAEASVRESALRILADHWISDEVRLMLTAFASDNAIESDLRVNALGTLAEHWTDDDSRRHLTEFARDESIKAEARVDALMTVDDYWSDDETHRLITEFAGDNTIDESAKASLRERLDRHRARPSVSKS